MTLLLDQHRHVHFIGVGGIGMSALARFLVARGFEVSGSDRQAGEQLDALRALGAHIVTGHNAENIGDADLVVVSSAVPADNPELMAAHHSSVAVIKRAVLLAAIMNAATGVAVAGTHGKTSTSALIGHVVLAAGLDATVLIGGISQNLGSNARTGSGMLVIVEADEFDGSFLHLQPSIGIITNVESDHLDFYESLAEIHVAFREFARQVRDLLIICADDPVLPSLVAGVDAKIVTYGLGVADWQAIGIVERAGQLSFQVRHGGREHSYRTDLAGLHNVRNILAAIVVADGLGIAPETMAAALADFRGVERRLEVKGEVAGVVIVDDYAHHPTEIQTVLAALKQRYDRPIRIIFQPHTYSRTHALLDEFAGAFADADAVYLMDIYAARESNTLGISGDDLACAVALQHSDSRYTNSPEATIAAVLADVQSGDLVLTAGAGDVSALVPALLHGLGNQ